MQKESLADRFQALVRTQTKKRRSCLKCGKKFMSTSAGHRRCGTCDQAVEGWSEKAETVVNA
jgi:ribosomal protein S27AE